jgi:hypothetical protein
MEARIRVCCPQAYNSMKPYLDSHFSLCLPDDKPGDVFPGAQLLINYHTFNKNGPALELITQDAEPFLFVRHYLLMTDVAGIDSSLFRFSPKGTKINTHFMTPICCFIINLLQMYWD